MLVTYVIYCVALSFNTRLERWAKSYNIPFLPKDDEPAEESALVSYRSLQEERLSYTGPNSPVTEQVKSQDGASIDLDSQIICTIVDTLETKPINEKKNIFLHRWWITGIWRTAAASAEAATVLQSEGAGPERGVTFGDAGRRNKVGTLLMGSRLSDSLRLQGDDARLPSGEMAKLVSIYILHFHDMDKLLQLHHGVDDHDNR